MNNRNRLFDVINTLATLQIDLDMDQLEPPPQPNLYFFLFLLWGEGGGEGEAIVPQNKYTQGNCADKYLLQYRQSFFQYEYNKTTLALLLEEIFAF